MSLLVAIFNVFPSLPNKSFTAALHFLRLCNLKKIQKTNLLPWEIRMAILHTKYYYQMKKVHAHGARYRFIHVLSSLLMYLEKAG